MFDVFSLRSIVFSGLPDVNVVGLFVSYVRRWDFDCMRSACARQSCCSAGLGPASWFADPPRFAKRPGLVRKKVRHDIFTFWICLWGGGGGGLLLSSVSAHMKLCMFAQDVLDQRRCVRVVAIYQKVLIVVRQSVTSVRLLTNRYLPGASQGIPAVVLLSRSC
jgi:hypothetical protein